MKKRPRNITSHSYDEQSRTLDVTFHTGKRYRYSDVDPDLAAGFHEAGGSGSFLHKHIAGVCSHQCLDGEHDHGDFGSHTP